MIKRAITSNRPFVHNIDEIRSNLSAMTEKMVAQNSSQSTSTGFQPETQSTSVIFYPKINNNETT